jgi:FkbM family methyltransferase
LFSRLLRPFEIATVCDIGSLDGADALLFRRMLPTADILALEANPRNFELMETDERLRRKSIRILPLAASDHDAEAPFYIVRAEYSRGRDRARRGMSSLHRRHDGSQLAEVLVVPTVRIDTLLASESLAGAPIALWIDAEGKGPEVIRGAAAVLPITRMLHVEVETKPVIGANQRLFDDIEKVLEDAGFALLATDEPPTAHQFNALFVRVNLLSAKAAEIARHVGGARLRHRIRTTVLPLLPGRMRALGFSRGWFTCVH